jgi:excisionase family DNA binding protein
MHRRLQFGMRENPASDRRHDSRLTVSGPVNRACSSEAHDSTQPASQTLDRANAGAGGVEYAAPPHTATGKKEGHFGANSVRRPRRAISQSSIRDFEPLISSLDAAKLLGNIHVKTLQRYARRGNLPGYQIGRHWYFRASELDAWLQSRIDLSCHPCRLQEKSDGT